MPAIEQKPSRRRLVFHDLHEVIRDAEMLHSAGYERAGNWDLAQICGHLAEWVRYPLDGFPRAPALLRPVLWGLRKTIGPRKLKRSFESRSMPSGLPTIPESIPPAGGEEAAAIERLREVIERFETHDGPLHPSPLFGALDHETAREMHLTHCAHHLSFLVPRDREGNGG